MDRLHLGSVLKPSRYIDNEWNAVHKDDPDGRFVLCYPDAYEVGTSNLGLQILYEIINKETGFAAERVYSPWPDMEELLRREGRPLTSLESGLPVAGADILGFTLQYELTYTNMLNVLDLSGLPLRASARQDKLPLVIAGGPCAYNPEPLAPFVDAFAIGEGEELVLEIIETYKRWRTSKTGKEELLVSLSRLEGVYVPALYELAGDGSTVVPISTAPAVVGKRIIRDLDAVEAPSAPPVPYTESVHDRAAVEIMRGCTRGCRFCQAGMIYRPVRERSRGSVARMADGLVCSTGYDELSLVSLSSTDHSDIEGLVSDMSALAAKKVQVSLPSMRVHSQSVAAATALAGNRRFTMTLAPEAGSQRLRDVINKGVTDEDITGAFEAAFTAGWQRLKLYFMIGLPTETDDDLRGIADLAHGALAAADRVMSRRDASRVKVIVSTSTFVSKSHTPFQWMGLTATPEIDRKQDYLKGVLLERRLDYKWHDADLTVLEALVARGGRELAGPIEEAWKLGCRFDGWSDLAKPELWRQALARHGVDLEAYVSRELSPEAPLPWDHIGSRLDKDWLIGELSRSGKCLVTGDCRDSECTICGVCGELGI